MPRCFVLWRFLEQLRGAQFMTQNTGKQFSETMRISVPQPEKEPTPRASASREKERTGKKVRSKRRRATHPHYEALFQSIYDGVLITDLDGRILDANTRAEAALHRSRDDLSELTITDVIAGFDSSVLQAVRDHATEPRFTLMEAYSVRRDGSMFPAEIVVHKLSLDKTERFSFLIRDITVRKQAEEAVRWANRRKLESLQNMAGGVAHDFNNKLTGVLGNAQLALQSLAPDATVREDIQRIIHSAEEMAELSQKMLAYSGRGHLLTLPLNLNTVLSELASILEGKISGRVSLDMQMDPEMPDIMGDRREIEQLVLHLLGNAGESIGDEDGTIKLSTAVRHVSAQSVRPNFPQEKVVPGFYACLKIEDTGHGMSADTLNRIFDPFFSTRFVGRGLGLPAVLGIVQGHNGLITAESQVGTGTTFTVFFPIPKDKTVIKPPRKSAAPDGKVEGRILITEDDPDVRDMVIRLLENAGFFTCVATDGRESIAMFKDQAADIDLVLLDMTLPEMNGAEVLVELRKIRPRVKVLLCSGYNEADVTRKFGAEKPDGFIHKPYQPEALISKLLSLLG